MKRWAAAVLVCSACSVVTPPPLTPPHEVAQPVPEGTTTVSLIGGVGGSLLGSGGYGVEVRVTRQVSDRTELGVGVGLARNGSRPETRAEQEARYQACEDASRNQGDMPLFAISCTPPQDRRHPRWLGAVRLFGRYNPSLDHDFFALTFGVSAGIADTGLTWLDLDAGFRLSSGGDRLAVVTNPVIGLAIPVRRGPPVDEGKRPRLAFLWALDLGLVGFPERGAGGSIDYSMTSLHSRGDDEVVFLVSGGAQLRDVADP